MQIRLAIIFSLVLVGMPSCSSNNKNNKNNDGRTETVTDRCSEPPTQFLPQQGTPDHLLVVDTTQLDTGDGLLLLTLQGNVNRTKPRIYAINGPTDGQALWLDDYETMYGITHETAPPLMDLVAQFSEELAGVIIIDPDFYDSINLATTLAGIHGALVVFPKHLDQLTIAALPVIEDLRGKWDDAEAMYDWMMKELWPQTNQKTIAALRPKTMDGWLGDGGADLRDYLVANRIFTFYRSPVGDEKEMLASIMDAIPDNLPVLGYLSIDGAEEIAAQKILNERSKWLIPTDNTQNLSVHSGVPANIESLRDLAPNPAPEPALGLEEIESHLVLTAALSDYDNYQVPLHVGRHFWDQSTRGTLPLTWGIPGTALTLAPGMVEYFYSTRTPNDDFMLPTALGYFTPSLYEDLDWIAAETTKAMCELGLDVMYPLDSINGMAEFGDAYRKSLIPFTDEFDMQGFFLNYFANGEGCGITGPNRVPYCYTSTSYSDGEGAITKRIEEALASREEGKPSFLFLGLNGWHYHPDRVLAEYKALSVEDSAKIKWVTQEQFFKAIRLAYQDAEPDTPVDDDDEPGIGPCPPPPMVCTPCEQGDEIELTLPKTSVILDPLAGNFELPEGLGALLQMLLPSGSIPPLLFGYQEMTGDEIAVLGAFAVDANPPITQDMNVPTLGIPKPAEWSCNPYVGLELDYLKIEIEGFAIEIQNLQITGKLDADANITEGTLGGIIDPAPLAEALEFNPCDMGETICNDDGFIEVLITGLVGEGIDTPVVEVPK